jgi:glycerophosphoryl diester phosphodiesterase
VSAILGRKLRENDWRSREITLTLESFDFKVLEQMKRVCGEIGEYVFLVDTWGQPMFDETAKIFHGISFNSVLVFGSDWLEQAKSRGLKVFIWTARAEEAENSTEEYFAKFVHSGADGVFTDNPDLLLEVANGLEH